MNPQYKIDLTAAYDKSKDFSFQDLYDAMLLGDDNARNQLIGSCLPLVLNIATKFHLKNKHIDLDDMIQEGNIACIKAVDNWDISRAKLSTVVTWYVTNALIDMIKDSKYSVKNKFEIPKAAFSDIKIIKEVCSQDVDEIHVKTKLSPKRIRLLLNIINSKRIDYTIANMQLHSNEGKESCGSVNLKGCLADLIELVNEHVADEQDRQVFFLWLKNIHKHNNTKITADLLGSTVESVGKCVRGIKKIIKSTIKTVENKKEQDQCLNIISKMA